MRNIDILHPRRGAVPDIASDESYDAFDLVGRRLRFPLSVPLCLDAGSWVLTLPGGLILRLDEEASILHEVRGPASHLSTSRANNPYGRLFPRMTRPLATHA